MRDFFKDNYLQLKQNFDREVVAKSDDQKLLNDEAAMKLAFYAFAQEEEQHNPSAYQNFSEKQVPEVRDVPKMDTTPTIDGKPISVPQRKQQPPSNPAISQEDIERVREINPEAAAHMESLIKNTPSLNGELPDISEFDRAVMDGVVEIFPSPLPPSGPIRESLLWLQSLNKRK